MSTVIVVRHGSTDYLEHNLYQGDSDASRLSIDGVEQSRSLNAYLASLMPARVLTSPLSRAVDTARLLIDGQHAIETDSRLREVRIGPYAGLKKSCIPPEVRHQWRDAPDELVLDDGSRPLSDLYERIGPLSQNLRQSGDTTIVVAHNHSGRALQLSLMDLPISAHANFKFSVSGVALLHREAGRSHLTLYASNLRHVGPSADAFRAHCEDRRLILVRHGVTDGDVERPYQGNEDHPLNEAGRRQMLNLRGLLQGISPAVVVSSCLRGATESAQLLPFPGSEPMPDCRLNEYDYGHRTSLGERVVGEQYPKEVDAWESLKVNQPIDSAERLREFSDRVWAGLREVLRHLGSGGTGVIVAHEVALRIAITLLLDLPLSHAWRFRMTNGAASELREDGSGHFVLYQHNALPGRLEKRNDNQFF
jgi:broad specificity phosphatase PhoE